MRELGTLQGPTAVAPRNFKSFHREHTDMDSVRKIQGCAGITAVRPKRTRCVYPHCIDKVGHNCLTVRFYRG